jgi:hypothetical protein
MTRSPCVGAVVTHPAPDRYTLHIQDNPAERRFDVALKSNDERPLCLSGEDWPDSSGQFVFGSNAVALGIGDGTALPAKSGLLLSAYCPGGCGRVHRIELKAELRGFVAYAAFGDATDVPTEPEKQLMFLVGPYYCPTR